MAKEAHSYVAVREWGKKPNRIAAGPFPTRAKAETAIRQDKRDRLRVDSEYYIVRVNLITEDSHG